MSAPKLQPTTHTFKGYVDDTMQFLLARQPGLAESMAAEARVAVDVGRQLGLPGCNYVSITNRPALDYRPDLEPHLEVFATAPGAFASLTLLRGKRKGILFETTDETTGVSIGYYLSPTRRAKMFERAHTRDRGLQNPARFFTPADNSQATAHVRATVDRTMAAIERIPNFQFRYE